MENQSNIGARCLYPGEANMVVPFIFSDLPASVVLMTEEGPIRLTGLSRSVQPSPTQSNLVQPNPTMAPLPGKETGKETVKFLATLDDPTRHSLPDDLKTENVTMPFAPFNLFNSFNLFNRPPAIFPILPFCLLALSCPMFITGLGTAAPQQRFTQKECWDVFSASNLSRQLDSRSRAIVKKVLTGNNGIVSRHLVLDRVDEAFDVTPDILHARYVKHAPLLATQAAERALADAGTERKQIDALIISTCTGYLCPGLTSYVGERLGLRPDVLNLDLVGQGCGAALPNLTTAHALLDSGRSKHVLSICVEVCSAALFFENDAGVLISACIFGDGAGAAVLSNAAANKRIEWKTSAS